MPEREYGIRRQIAHADRIVRIGVDVADGNALGGEFCLQHALVLGHEGDIAKPEYGRRKLVDDGAVGGLADRFAPIGIGSLRGGPARRGAVGRLRHVVVGRPGVINRGVDNADGTRNLRRPAAFTIAAAERKLANVADGLKRNVVPLDD